MPQIIVTAGEGDGFKQGTVMLRERVTATDFESDRFATNLLERLGWAVEDAVAAEERELVSARNVPGPAEHNRPDLSPDWDPSPVGVA
jgi:hypothetical protein